MEEVREVALEALKEHKGSWIGIGKVLVKVKKDGLSQDWGFKSFNAYTKEELGLTPMTAKGMMEAYEYIEENRPELLKEENKEGFIPDFNSICKFEKSIVGSEMEDEILDMQEEFFSDSSASRKVLSNLKESMPDSGDVVLDIRKETNTVKKLAKKLRNKIEMTSSFGPDVIEETEKLCNMIEAVDIL